MNLSVNMLYPLNALWQRLRVAPVGETRYRGVSRRNSQVAVAISGRGIEFILLEENDRLSRSESRLDACYRL